MEGKAKNTDSRGRHCSGNRYFEGAGPFGLDIQGMRIEGRAVWFVFFGCGVPK